MHPARLLPCLCITACLHAGTNLSDTGDTSNGLVAGTLLHPIDAYETGAAVNGFPNVWTNTLHNGTKTSDTHCSAWTVNDNTMTTIGQSSATDATWTNLANGQLCSNALRLYCFEDL